ncbi:MAG: hypothetical protein F4W95_01920 [Chloroflexi bacterium]|nr:hypothetical protein [Chloroflexota bacterium]MYD47224.1 hypothetical protein [Chloroflexota bacterium]
MDSYVQQNGYQDIISTQPAGSMLRDLKITSQSSMLAMDAHSVITFRKGYGRGADEQTLRAEFERLTQQ